MSSWKYYDKNCDCKQQKLVTPMIKNLFNETDDPYKMRSIHCIIFPETENCRELLYKALT